MELAPGHGLHGLEKNGFGVITKVSALMSCEVDFVYVLFPLAGPT